MKNFKTEQEMREEVVPKMNSLWDLMMYIKKQVNHEHDYGTAVYAVSLASYATFKYVASKLGLSGFQASCADLDIIRRTSPKSPSNAF